MALTLSYSLADQNFYHTKSIGVWNVATQLLPALAARPELERLTVFSNPSLTALNFPSRAGLTSHARAASSRIGRIIWDQWGAYRAAKRSGNHWLFLPKGFASFVRRCPVSLAAFVHDAMHEHYQQHYQPNPFAREAGYFLRSLRATLRQADIIFTNSDFTRSEVLRLARTWNLKPSHVLTAGIGFDLPPAGAAAFRNGIVVLAGRWPHKLTPRAVDYLQRWSAASNRNVPVSWVGALPAGLTLPSLPGWTQHLRLPAAEYEQILQRAAVVVYFSAYEGFGMPPVEATLRGAAAVYSAIPAITESMGDCGFPFANDSFESFERALNEALAVPPGQTSRWRERLLARHNWAAVAERIVTALLQLEKPNTVDRAHA